MQENTIVVGDCLDVMATLPDKVFDMVLCDLPYQITARNEWDVIIPFEPLWEHYKRLIKGNGAICLTATEPFSSMLVMSNLAMFRYDLIWEKTQSTGFLNANRMPLRNHEQILIFYKALPTYNPQKTEGEPYSRPQTDVGTNYNETAIKQYVTVNTTGERYPVSVLRIKKDGGERVHPTQKPVALFEYLIRTYTNEGDLVLDNCIGSGTTAIAADRLGRRFYGCDISAEYVDLALKRLERDRLERSQLEMEL